MKQLTSSNDNKIAITVTLTLKERIRLLFKGSMILEIDKSNSLRDNSKLLCYYIPQFFKEKKKNK